MLAWIGLAGGKSEWHWLERSPLTQRRMVDPSARWFEHDAVVHHDAGDVAEGLGHGFQIARAVAKQVRVACDREQRGVRSSFAD